MSKRPRSESDSAGLQTHLNQNVQPPAKYTQLHSSSHTTTTTTITCSLPPHQPEHFDTYDAYQTHYHKAHVNRCVECARNFPTGHFLDLHISENHDAFNATKRERGEKIFRCFVQDCEKVCRNPQKRRMHLIDKHMFPKNYDFFIVNHGSDNLTSLLTPDQSRPKRDDHRQHQTSIRDDHVNCNVDQKVENIEPKHGNMSPNDVSMAALNFVPKSVSFGRGHDRRGFSKD